MSYGLYVINSDITLGQMKELVKTTEYEHGVHDSGEFYFGNIKGWVTFGFINNDEDVIGTISIRGMGELYVRPLIFQLDPNTCIIDEEKLLTFTQG